MIDTSRSSTLWQTLRGVRPALRVVKKTLYRKLNISRMRCVIRRLKQRGVDLQQLKALEVFGGTGDYSVGVCHMLDYRREVASVEAWEVRQDYGERLQRNFPWVRVEVGDAHRKVAETEKEKRFGLVVVDNPELPYGPYCEHFDLFPNILRIVADSAILILNVMVETNERFSASYPHIFGPHHLARRRAFYRTSHPEKVPLAEMVPVYRHLLAEAGFDLEWCFWQDRNLRLDLLVGSVFPPMYYLVLKVGRRRRQRAVLPGVSDG